MNTPTPGPWKATKYPDCKTWTIYAANGVTVASRMTEADAKLIAATREQLQAPVPELMGSLPVVIYFGTEEDREGFIALVTESKPGLVAQKL